MSTPATGSPLPFDAVSRDDIEAFSRQKENILAAVIERINSGAVTVGHPTSEQQIRLAIESARILTENFFVCVKHQLPGALDDYLTWLRSFLAQRDFPASFLPHLLHSLMLSSQAYVDLPAGDHVSTVLRALRRRELARNTGADPS